VLPVGAVITATLLRSGRLPTDSASKPGAGYARDDEEQAKTNGDDAVELDALRRVAELETENRYLQEVLHIRTAAAPAPRSPTRVIASK
jgi:hypothetical protein